MNTTSISIPRWTYACLVAAVAFSLVSLFYRHKVEHRNNAVAMAVEGDVVESLGAAQGLGFKAALRALRADGYNAVVLSEETIGELVSSGLLTQEAIASADVMASAAPTLTFRGDAKSMERVVSAFDFPKRKSARREK